jgi:selenocysteine-specific elongation factor
VVYPAGRETRIRGIQVHGRDTEQAVPGLRTALNLQGVGKDEIRRGDVVATPGSLHPSYLLDLEFMFLKSAEKPMKHRTPVRFHAGTAEVMGRILLREDEIKPGEQQLVQVQLEEPVAVLPGDFYVIRSYSPVRTIGGGRILNPVPRRRKRTRPELWDEMKILATGSSEELVSYHIRQSGIRGLSKDEVAIRTGIYGKPLAREIDRLLGKKELVKSDSDGRFVHVDVYEALKQRLVAMLDEYHERNPLVQGIAKEELRSRLFRHGQGVSVQRLFKKALSDLEKSGEIVVEQDTVRLSGHEVALGERESEVRERLDGIFLKAGLQPEAPAEIVEKVALDMDVAESSVKDVLDLMLRDGALVRLRDNIFIHPLNLAEIEKKVVKFLTEQDEMGVKDFRELAGGISRKYMIPLLEHLDNKKVTLRLGDVRRLRKRQDGRE